MVGICPVRVANNTGVNADASPISMGTPAVTPGTGPEVAPPARAKPRESSRAARLVARARNFTAAYAWLTATHLRRHIGLVIGVAGLGFLSAVAQGGVIGFVVLSLRTVQNPHKVGIPGIDELLARPGTALVVFGICLTAISGLGTLARYNAARCCRRIGRLFHERIIADSIALMHAIPAFPASLGFQDEGQFQRAVTRNGAVLGRTTESFVRMIEPTLRLVVGIGILFIIDARLAFILVPLFGLLLPVLYISGMQLRRGAESFYEESTVEFGRRVRDVVQYLNSQNVADTPEERVRVREMVNEASDVRLYLDQFDAMTLASEKVQFMVNSASATVLGLALIGAGWLATSGQIEWSQAMASLMALWQVQSAAQQVGANLSMLNRFYPFITQTRRVLSAERPDQPVPASAVVPGTARDEVGISLPRAAGDGTDAVHLGPGDRACLVCDVPLDRIRLEGVLRPLVGPTGRPMAWWHANARFVSNRYRVLHRPLSELLATAPGTDYRGLLDDLGVAGEVNNATGADDAPMTPAHWASLSGPARAVLSLLPALADRRPILLCDGRLIHGLRRDISARLMDLFTDRLVLIHFSDPTTRLYLAPTFIVCREQRFLGAGSPEWYAAIAPTLGPPLPSGAGGDGIDDDDQMSML